MTMYMYVNIMYKHGLYIGTCGIKSDLTCVMHDELPTCMGKVKHETSQNMK